MHDPRLIAEVEFSLLKNGELVFQKTVYRKGNTMASLAELKTAIDEVFANAEDGIARAATVTQAAADAFKAMQSGQPPGDNPLIQELVDLVRKDGQELVDRATQITTDLAAAIPVKSSP